MENEKMTLTDSLYALRKAILKREWERAEGIVDAIIDQSEPDPRDENKIVITNTQDQRVSQTMRIAAIGGWLVAIIAMAAVAFLLSR